MRWRKKLLPGIMAAVFVFGSVEMPVGAADIQVDTQIPATEVESVYEQQVMSNTLEAWPEESQIYSESGIVMDIDSGAILYAKNIDDQHYPASITKLMTALVALENYELTDRVRFTWDCIGFLEYGDAHIGMQPDEEISMEDALYGMLLASANEVSYAIADTDENGYDAFIKKMNQKAKELGCKNSHFVNANGLHDDEHYTSVRDMALIGSAVFQYDTFRTITNTRQHTIPATNLTSETRTFQQNHKMIRKGHQYYYEYCVGGKTGFTDQALTTLVTFAAREGRNLVSVVMRTHGGGQNAYKDTRAMLDYAFDNFSKVRITKEMIDDENIKSIDGNAYVVLPAGVTLKKLEAVREDSTALGDKTGTITYTYNGQEVGKFEVTLTDKYYNKLHGIKKEKKEKEEERKEEKQKSSVAVKLIIGAVLALFVIWLGLYSECRRRRRVKRRKRKQKRMEHE